jgi:hypothetical protein
MSIKEIVKNQQLTFPLLQHLTEINLSGFTPPLFSEYAEKTRTDPAGFEVSCGTFVR